MSTEPVSHSASTGAVKITGLTEFVAHVKELDEALPLVIKEILTEGAALVARLTVRYAPVGSELDRDTHPGALARSVRYGAVLTSRSTYSFVSIGGRGNAGQYAGPVIFGDPHHSISPNPFPYRALDEAGPVIYLNAGTQLQKVVDEVFARSDA